MAEINPLYTDFKEQQTSPATPGSGLIVYVKYNKHIYTKDSNGLERDISSTISTLDGLGDVIITSPTDGQYLKFNGTNWVNSDTPTNISAMDDLTDVSGVSGANSREVLVRSGGIFKPKKNLPATTSSNLSTGQVIPETPTVDQCILLANSGGTTNIGDTELWESNGYFKSYIDADYTDYGGYVVCGYMRLSLSAGSGDVEIKPYRYDGSTTVSEVDDVLNTSPLATFNMSSGTDVWWHGFYVFAPDSGNPQFNLGVENNASGDITAYYSLTCYKLGHLIQTFG
jgi:hypothetical protein